MEHGFNKSTRDYSISLIRIISLLMIIICHIMQHEEYVLAWWFNVGVQIFLCISGFLYGQKNVNEITEFYKKRFSKILIPYYVVFLTVALFQLLFKREYFNIFRFGGGIFLRTKLAGGEHLWFVSMILFCYFLTPILQAYRDEYENNRLNFLIVSMLEVIFVSIFCGLYDRYFNPAWVSCYTIGYAIGWNKQKSFFSDKLTSGIFAVLAIIGNAIQIYIDNIVHIQFYGYIKIAYDYFCNYNHVFLGVFLFLVMLNVFNKINYLNNPKLISFLKITDEYSYEAYLVHQFLILGPFSLMALTSIKMANVLIIIISICLLAWLLKKSEGFLMNKIGEKMPNHNNISSFKNVKNNRM